jgi:hypothetical protein
VTRVNEDICTARYQVMRFGANGQRRRVGKICLIAGQYHAYRGDNNDYVGCFNNQITAGNAI